jgi:hypothetical protein
LLIVAKNPWGGVISTTHQLEHSRAGQHLKRCSPCCRHGWHASCHSRHPESTA